MASKIISNKPMYIRDYRDFSHKVTGTYSKLLSLVINTIYIRRIEYVSLSAHNV